MSKNSLFESNNPIMSEDKYRSEAHALDYNGEARMTVSGAINKSLMLFGILLLTSSISFVFPHQYLMIGGFIGSLIAVLVASFKPHTSPITAPLYAAFQGLTVGAVSAFYAHAFNGIIFHAVTLTFSIFFLMLMIYKYNIIPVTEKFRSGLVMATMSIFLVYLLTWVLSLFGIQVPYLFSGGIVEIGISCVIIVIAALNFLLDFDMIDKGAAHRAPAYMEWFAGMGLLVTLIWLYMRILRLLSIFMGRD